MKKNNNIELEELCTAVIEQNPTPIMITDTSGKMEYVNAKFIQLTGYTGEELIGKNPRMLSAGLTSAETYEDLWRTILSGCEWHGDLFNKRKNGKVYQESLFIKPIKNGDGKMTHFVGAWQDITERNNIEEELKKQSKEFEKLSKTDYLTGQYNRRHILTELEKEVERAERYGRQLSGMMLDIDDFKTINDEYGHLIGDRVIKTIAAVIQKSIRKIDILGRYGGDEFLVILPESTLEMARKVGERIQKNLAVYQMNVLGAMGAATLSIGLLSFDKTKNFKAALFVEETDQALLQAKRTGKNRIVVAGEFECNEKWKTSS